MNRWRPVWGLILALSGWLVWAGPWISLEQHVARAAALGEVVVGENGQAIRGVMLWGGAQQEPWPGGVEAKAMLSADCRNAMPAGDEVRVLVFFRAREDGRLTPDQGVENRHGFYSSFNPHYAALKQELITSLEGGLPLSRDFHKLQAGHYCGG